MRGGERGVQDSAIIFFGSKKHNGQAENDLFHVCVKIKNIFLLLLYQMCNIDRMSKGDPLAPNEV